MRLTVSAMVLGITTVLFPASQAQTPSPSVSAVEPSYTAPRTSFGQPSLEGIWNHNFLMIMEAAEHEPQPLVISEEAAHTMAKQVAQRMGDGSDRQLDPEVPELMKAIEGLPIVRGQRRTRVVVQPSDGRLPYTPEARQASTRNIGNAFDGPENRPNWERCITSLGLPPVTGVATTSVNPRQIVQTPDFVIIHTEYGNEARIIPLTKTHKPKPIRDILGDSIASWEGDTLVVETVDLPAKDRFRAFSNLVVSGDAIVIERFTRVSENELLYQYTVQDAATYTAPWLAEYSLYKTSQQMFEHACHEGNYSLPNILKGARINENRK